MAQCKTCNLNIKDKAKGYFYCSIRCIEEELKDLQARAYKLIKLIKEQ